MTAVTALSILRGTKRGMKVKDNFTFFLHRWSPWGSLGNPGEARSRPRQVGDAQETGVCTQGGDGLGLGLGSGSGSNTSHVWHPCSLSPVSSSTTRKSSRCRGGRGLKGVGLKDQHKAWCTSGSVRPGWRGSGSDPAVPGTGALSGCLGGTYNPGVPAGTASGSACPGASPGVAPLLLGQPGEAPSARQLLPPRL